MPSASSKRKIANAPRPAGSKWEQHDDEGKMDAEKRMQEAVRKQGKLTKRGGVLGFVGTEDYQIAGGGELEKMVGGYGGGSSGGGGEGKGGGGKRKR